MADNDVKIKVSLEGDKLVISGLEGIGDQADKTDSKLGGLVKGGLKGAGAALAGFSAAAVAAGAALTAGVVSAYADYEQNIGGIETMFKDASGTMMQYADDAYRTAGLSANDYMSQVTSFSAALIQGLGGDTAAAAEAANTAMVDMSDNANKFGSNITDIQNAYQGFAKQNYTMLDNLKLGYGGTAEEMARLINDSGVMGDTFEATAKNMNEVSFDKIVEAIHTVQDNMGIAGTTAKEATETISGSIGMLRSSFDNLLTGLGSADADVATLAGNVIDSLELVVTNITPVIENIGSNISTLGPKLGDMMSGVVGAVATALPAILQAGTSIVQGLVSGISTALPDLITALVPGVVGLVQTLSGMLPLLLDAGFQAVTALVEGLAEAAPMIITSGIEMVVGLVDSIVQNLPMLLDAALLMIEGIAQGLLEALPFLIESLPMIITGITTFLVGAIPTIIQTGIQLLMGIVGALPEIITGLVAAIPQIITGLVSAIIGSIPQLVQSGIALLLALVQALPEIIVGIVEAIPQIITAVIDAVIDSIPLLVDSGIQLLMGLIGALPQIIGGVAGAIPQIIGGILGAIFGAIPQLIDAGFRLLTAMVSNLGGIVGSIGNSIGYILSTIFSAVGNGASRMWSIGTDLIRGLWDGISGMGGWLWGQISGFVDDVMGNIAGFFGIHSPSRRVRDEIGVQLPAGLAEGVDDGTRVAVQSVTDMSKRVMDAAEIPTLGFSQDVTQTLTQQVDPVMIPGSIYSLPAPPPPTAQGGFTITGPLVQVDSMTVRDDQDIRDLSSELRTDMTRELRAQGVLT